MRNGCLMHVDIENPSLSWALSSGWPSLNSTRNPKLRNSELSSIKRGQKEFMTICNRLLG